MTTRPPGDQPCTWRPAECTDCALGEALNCRFAWRHLAYFASAALPPFVAAAAGMVRAGYGWWLLGWLAYMLLFFNVWETWVLCRHCPYYAEEGRVLHCIANYGMIKLWPYQPGPMSRAEGAQFLLGGLILLLYPFPFILLGGEWLLAALTLIGFVGGAYGVRTHVCSRCVNLSCPANTVPRPVVEADLRHNPAMARAWEERAE